MNQRPNTLMPDSPNQLVSIRSVSETDARGEVDMTRGVRIVLAGPAIRPHRVERPIASTIDEARAKGWDYWDPRFNNGTGSWIRGGVKAERDYDDNLGYDFFDYLNPPTSTDIKEAL